MCSTVSMCQWNIVQQLSFHHLASTIFKSEAHCSCNWYPSAGKVGISIRNHISLSILQRTLTYLEGLCCTRVSYHTIMEQNRNRTIPAMATPKQERQSQEHCGKKRREEHFQTRYPFSVRTCYQPVTFEITRIHHPTTPTAVHTR